VWDGGGFAQFLDVDLGKGGEKWKEREEGGTFYSLSTQIGFFSPYFFLVEGEGEEVRKQQLMYY